MKFFISHSSRDRKIAEKFVDNIFCEGLGINRLDIFCSSIEGLDVEVGRPIINTIKQKIEDADVVIFIITQNFLKSDFCKYELGASWIKDKRLIPITFNVAHSETGEIIRSLNTYNIQYHKHLLAIVEILIKIGNNPVSLLQINNAIKSFLKYLRKIQIKIKVKIDIDLNNKKKKNKSH